MRCVSLGMHRAAHCRQLSPLFWKAGRRCSSHAGPTLATGQGHLGLPSPVHCWSPNKATCINLRTDALCSGQRAGGLGESVPVAAPPRPCAPMRSTIHTLGTASAAGLRPSLFPRCHSSTTSSILPRISSSRRGKGVPAHSSTCSPATYGSPHGLEGGSLGEENGGGVRSAYVHLPFCKRKCFYCDFPVEAVGKDLASPRVTSRMQSYVDVLLREIAATRQLPGGPLQTVFFGGGTPSLLPPELLGAILEALDHRFGIAAGAEVSLEADPGTFDAARLAAYRALGVTRLSVGVQAFQQPLLEACGRGHDLADVHAAVEAVHASGMPSWSLDLISGLPGLDLAAWLHSLDAAVAAGPHHVSVYDLQVEEGTPFERWRRAGRIRLPPDDAAVEMYEAASERLRAAGYEHYEVSNYAKPGHRSAHNQVYWSGRPYHAFGLGAASYLEGRRFSRPAKMRAYYDWVDQLEREGGDGGALPGGHLPRESKEELLLDTVMLRLRTAAGVDLAELRRRFGPEAAAAVAGALAPHEPLGHVWGLDGQGSRCAVAAAQRIRLSDPRGFLMSNDVISDVFAAFDLESLAGEEAAGAE